MLVTGWSVLTLATALTTFDLHRGLTWGVVAALILGLLYACKRLTFALLDDETTREKVVSTVAVWTVLQLLVSGGVYYGFDLSSDEVGEERRIVSNELLRLVNKAERLTMPSPKTSETSNTKGGLRATLKKLDRGATATAVELRDAKDGGIAARKLLQSVQSHLVRLAGSDARQAIEQQITLDPSVTHRMAMYAVVEAAIEVRAATAGESEPVLAKALRSLPALRNNPYAFARALGEAERDAFYPDLPIEMEALVQARGDLGRVRQKVVAPDLLLVLRGLDYEVRAKHDGQTPKRYISAQTNEALRRFVNQSIGHRQGSAPWIEAARLLMQSAVAKSPLSANEEAPAPYHGALFDGGWARSLPQAVRQRDQVLLDAVTACASDLAAQSNKEIARRPNLQIAALVLEGATLEALVHVSDTEDVLVRRAAILQRLYEAAPDVELCSLSEPATVHRILGTPTWAPIAKKERQMLVSSSRPGMVWGYDRGMCQPIGVSMPDQGAPKVQLYMGGHFGGLNNCPQSNRETPSAASLCSDPAIAQRCE